MTTTGDGLAVPDGTNWGEAAFLAAVAAVPVLGGSLVVLLQKTLEDDRRRIADVANSAREVIDDDERFVRRLEHDERLRDMLREALEAGRRTANEAKRVAMGRVLGQAVNDDARIDDSAAMLGALAALDSQHFALVAAMVDGTPNDAVPEPYRSALVAQGVISSRSVGTPGPAIVSILEVTDFGRRLLQWLREAEPST